MPIRVTEQLRQQETLRVSLTGQFLLHQPLLNKGNAFTAEERQAFGLVGLLPPHISSMEEQVARSYGSYLHKDNDLERYIFLAALQDRDEVLFYRLLLDHLREMCPMVYTPVVGLACQQYSHIYRRPRGLYLAYPDRNQIEAILRQAPSQDVRVIVVTDGERILGLGDLGIGGMDIPIGKLTLYSLCAGIHPSTTLPVYLDLGTDNEELLADPLYLGWHHHRVRGADYDAFVDAFVQAVKRTFPTVLLQWEDFAKGNARRLLSRYQNELCSFNDDIQGTGAVTVAGLLAAVKRLGAKLSEQTVVLLGAGSAATGIAEQLVTTMVSEGRSRAEAHAAIWLLDSRGLLHTGRQDLDPEKRLFAQPSERLAGWSLASQGAPGLEEVVAQVHPTILIGTAAQAAAFTEAVVREMASQVERPIIFPLSNPTSKSEAAPADLLTWTAGRALIATGSPFPDVDYHGQKFPIGQCNNMFIFPGVGLGVLAAKAQRVTETMFLAAAHALSDCSPALQSSTAALYPPVEAVREVAERVAIAVGLAAQQTGVAEPTTPEQLMQQVKAQMWIPQYPHLLYQPPQI